MMMTTTKYHVTVDGDTCLSYHAILRSNFFGLVCYLYFAVVQLSVVAFRVCVVKNGISFRSLRMHRNDFHDDVDFRS